MAQVARIVAGTAARLAIALLAFQLAQDALLAARTIAASAGVILPEPAYRIPLILALVSFVKPRAAVLAALLALLRVMTTPDASIVARFLGLSLVLVLYEHAGMARMASLKRLVLTTVSLLIYGAGIIGGVLVAMLVAEFTSRIPPLRGDAGTIIGYLHGTLLYKVIAASLALGFAFKAASAIADLVLAVTSTGQYARALVNEELTGEEEGLIHFKGSQYPILEWTVRTLAALLLAPVVYPPVFQLSETLLARLDPRITAALSTIVALVASWLVFKAVLGAVLRATVSWKPERRAPLLPIIASLIMMVGLLSANYILGGDPLALIGETLTGEPMGGDVLSRVPLGSPGEDYYRNLGEIVDLLARLFWGG